MSDNNTVNVLLIEDDPADAVLFTRVMQQVKSSEFHVTHVSRLEEATPLFDSDKYDIILLDLWLPGSNGMETLRRVVQQVSDVPIVVLTGLDDEQVALDALRQGAEDYLIKRDITNRALLSRSIRYAIQRKRAEREIRQLNTKLEERVLLRTTELETVNQQLQDEVAERTRAEQELRIAIEEQRLALRAASMGHWTWNIADDRISWGPGVERLFGLSETDSLQGFEDAMRRIHEDDRRSVRDQFKRTLAEPCGFEAEFRIVWPDGTIRWLSSLGAVDRNDEGQPVRMYGIVQDVTERKDSDAAWRRAQRLASLGTMAAGIAHEINNPIAAVLNSAEAALIARDNPRATSIVQECLTNVIGSAHRCAEIVTNVLKFARQEPTEKRPYDLNAIIRTAQRRTLNNPTHQHVTIELDLADRLPNVSINAIAIEQVLMNLLGNAIQASGERPKILVRTKVGASAVRMSVKDDGHGMTEQQLEHAFDPFFSSRQNHGGTGLGLSIAHGIIEEHGGQMSIESQAEAGTKATIDLPIAPSD